MALVGVASALAGCGGASSLVVVPNVAGLRTEAARELMCRSGVVPGIELVQSDELKAHGIVAAPGPALTRTTTLLEFLTTLVAVDSEPGAGASVPRGTAVTLHLASVRRPVKGPERPGMQFETDGLATPSCSRSFLSAPAPGP